MEIPLILKLKKEEYKKIALAQDIIIEELFKIFDNAVLHGGTAIWRCYMGNRFSEDVDAYISKDVKKIELFFENLQKKDFTILKKKISNNSIYSSLEFNRINIRFEALFKKEKGILKDYLTAQGNFSIVSTLTPEQLIKEKVSAYANRRKIRDLYDIFFLIKYSDKNEILNSLNKLLESFEKPIDEKDLKVLIIEGIIPEVKQMLDYIRDSLK